jgi:RNA polymerase sigma-70 factor (ECF subfamily)
MAQLSAPDQEIILLRHAEGLCNSEIAEVLEIDPRAASKRYGRAIGRLSTELRRLGFHSM